MEQTATRNKPMLGFALGALLFALSVPAEAQQQPKNISRIAYLSLRTASSLAPNLDAFRRRLRELGHVEGKNIVFEYRFAEGKRDLLPAMAAELVGLKVDVIVTGGGGATRPAKEAT